MDSLINDFKKNNKGFIIIDYLILIITYTNSLIFIISSVVRCEALEHLVRKFGTYCVNFMYIGENFMNTHHHLYSGADFRKIFSFTFLSLGADFGNIYCSHICISLYLGTCIFMFDCISIFRYVNISISVYVGMKICWY